MSTASELRKLDLAELKTRQREDQKALAKMLLDKGGKEKDVHRFMKARHKLATLKLVISEKELVA
jgi:ribosomal protein L29